VAKDYLIPAVQRAGTKRDRNLTILFGVLALVFIGLEILSMFMMGHQAPEVDCNPYIRLDCFDAQMSAPDDPIPGWGSFISFLSGVPTITFIALFIHWARYRW
jgi:hypothetical protein